MRDAAFMLLGAGFFSLGYWWPEIKRGLEWWLTAPGPPSNW
jgi:hypothetical protein